MPTQNAFSDLDQTRQQGRFTARRCVLADQQAVTPGIWYDAQLMHPFTITIGGTFVATLQVLVSNGVFGGVDPASKKPIITNPPDGDGGWPTLGPNTITTPYTVLSDGPYKYVKVVVVDYTSGVIEATWAAAVTVSDKA